MFRIGSYLLLNTDKMSNLHSNLLSGWVQILAFTAVNSASRESLSRTLVGFVCGVLGKKGIEWMVRYRIWVLVKDMFMALASFDSNTRDGFITLGRDLSLGVRRNRGGWWEKRKNGCGG